MRLRAAMATDIDAWVELRAALWPHYSRAQLAVELKEFLANPDRYANFFVEDSNGRLIGFAEGSIRRYADGCASRDVGYLEGWYVAPEFLRQGIGRQLVQAVEAWARSKGCREMASDCLLDNAVSERAHYQLGFEEAERLIHFKKDL